MNTTGPLISTMAPQARVDIPNHSNFQPDQELLRLRRRMGDLLRMGALTPETFQQAIFQLFQEAERRRLTCLQEAEDHLRKYHALLSQAGAFAAHSSILFSVINGFASLEEKRLQEMAARDQEKAQQEAEAKAEEERKAAEQKTAEAPPAPEHTPTNGQPAQEAAGDIPAKPSGGRRKKP